MNLKTTVLFIVMTALWSCKKDNEKEQDLNQSDIHLSMEIAKDLLSNFESREKSNLRESIPRNLISSKNRIDWQKAKEYMLNGYKIIEVPYKRDTLTFRNYSYEPYSKNTGYSEIKNIQTKILISEKNLGSTISIDIINYIPKKNTSLNTSITDHLSLNNLGNWSGHIEYIHLNNEIFHLLSVERGTVLKSDAISINSELENKTLTATGGSCVVCIPKYVVICVGPIPGFGNDPLCSPQVIGTDCIDYCPGIPGSNPAGPIVGDSGRPADGSLAETTELKAFELDYKTQMSQSELVIFNKMSRVNQLRYLVNARSAINLAPQIIPPTPGHHTYHGLEDRADAFRHAYFHLWNTYSLGRDLAKQLGDAHENNPYISEFDELSRSMDLFNNYVGREAIESISPNFVFDRQTEFIQIIKYLVDSGQMRYIKKNSDGTYYLQDTNIY